MQSIIKHTFKKNTETNGFKTITEFKTVRYSQIEGLSRTVSLTNLDETLTELEA